MSRELRTAIRDAARAAFSKVLSANPEETFYYFALITTGDALRPGPCASSVEGLARALSSYRASGRVLDAAELRWSEADSPYNLAGDEHFSEVELLFQQDGDHRQLPADEYEAEVQRRFAAMEGALRDLDRTGFFGTGDARHGVVINVVAPGEEDESAVLERAARLNPDPALATIKRDLGSD